jgi:hypothetical protein
MSSKIALTWRGQGHLFTLLATMFTMGCAAHQLPPPVPMPIPPQLPPEGPTTNPVPRPVPPEPAPEPGALGFSPGWGTAGSEIHVQAGGFEPGATVEIGLAAQGEAPRTVATLTADAHGALHGTVTVPEWARTDRAYTFVAGSPGQPARLISDVFHVTDADGVIRVEGRLTDEGVECPALRTADDRLYTLAGSIGEFRVGDRVVVEGTLPDASICMQGITVSVRKIEAAPPAGG